MALSHTLTSHSSFTPMNNQLIRQFEGKNGPAGFDNMTQINFFSPHGHWKSHRKVDQLPETFIISTRKKLKDIERNEKRNQCWAPVQYGATDCSAAHNQLTGRATISLASTDLIHTDSLSFRPIFIFIGPRPGGGGSFWDMCVKVKVVSD